MNCPKCQQQLESRQIKKVNVDVCPQCEGIWFDKDELRKAKDQAEPDLNWMDFDLWKHKDRFLVSAKPLTCPKSGDPMATIAYADTGIEIEYCIKCEGIWLDGGEFEKIIDALNDELNSKSASEYIKTSLEEAKEIITGSEGIISEWKDFLTVLHMMQYRILIENPRVQKALDDIQRYSPFI